MNIIYLNWHICGALNRSLGFKDDLQKIVDFTESLQKLILAFVKDSFPLNWYLCRSY